MNLYQKLVEVRKSIPYLQKDKRAFNYNYASGTQVLSALRAKIDELGLLLVTNVLKSSHQDVIDEKGKQERLVTLEMKFVWINAEQPEERLEVIWQSMGQNAREKGIGSAFTYAERYFLLKSFNVPTDDLDPDAYDSEYRPDATKSKSNGGDGTTGATGTNNAKATPTALPEAKKVTPNGLPKQSTDAASPKQKLLDEITKEIHRTCRTKEEIQVYCNAQKFPLAAKECNAEQLGYILKHLQSFPTKNQETPKQEQMVDTTPNVVSYETGAMQKK